MGLDFSHCDARWGYSGFNIFRAKLAAEAGIALHCMESFAWNFNLSQPCDKVAIYDFIPSKPPQNSPMIGIQPVIKWSAINDPIKPFLNHSDCEGELTVEELKRVLPRMLQLIKGWDDSDRDKIKAWELAEGMEKAIEKGEPLLFL